MSGEEIGSFEDEELASWMAAGDDALAAGRRPEDVAAGAAPGLRRQLQADLAYAGRVRQVLRRPTPAATPNLPWTRLARFQIRRELGQGGFGMVFLAYDPLLRREVAIKVPRADALVTPELRARFHREACAASGLDHPNLVSVYEAAELGPTCFIVTAYCPGTNLAAWLQTRADPVPLEEAAQLTATLAEAVHHAHRHGVCHRDLKPANILLKAAGPAADPESARALPLSALTPMVADFGLARLEGDPGQTQSGAVLGTPAYMAPEQAGGRNQMVGPPADVYALGAILYELVTGRPPFRGENNLETLALVQSAEPVSLARLRPRVPRDLETICLKCLEKDPAKRYASAADLATDLQHFRQGRPLRARPVSRVEHLSRWCRRNPALAGAAGLAAVALLATAVVSTLFALYFAASLRESEANRLRSKRQEANLALDRAVSLGERGQPNRAMLWLAHSLALAEQLEAHDLARAIRANLGAWYHHLPKRPLVGHQGPITAVAVSPDGRIILTGSRDGTARRWHAHTHRPIGEPLAHGGPVRAVAFSPDGQKLLTGGEDGTARLWDAGTGEPLGAPLVHAAAVHAVAFRANGAMIVTGCADRTARRWDAATGQPVGDPLPHSEDVVAIAFSPDGQTIVTGCLDGAARLWEATTGAPVGAPLAHPTKVLAVAFSPDGRTVATGDEAGTARLWEASTGRLAVELPVHKGPIRGVAFSPEGKAIATGGDGSHAELWDVATGKLIGDPFIHFSADGVKALAFHPGGTLVTGSTDGIARVWRTEKGDDPGLILRHRDAVQLVAFSPDGRLALTGGFDRQARLWDVATGRPVGGPLPHDGTVHALAFSPDGRLALTGGQDGTARLWEVATGKLVHRLTGHQGAVRAVAFGPPDGRIIATASTDSTARFWDLGTGRLRGELMRHDGAVGSWALAFSPDGRLLVTGSIDKTARLWETPTGKPIGAPLPHDAAVAAVAFSRDGKLLLTGSQSARLWDVATRQPIGNPFHHHGQIRSVAFSSDGRRVLTGSFDQTAQVWDTGTQQPIGERLQHQGLVRDVAFSPDGTRVLTGSFDRTVRLWDAATGKPIGPPLRHGDWVVSVAFHPDGETVLTASSDGTARLWEAPPAVEGSVERIGLWTQVLTRLELGPDGVARALEADRWRQCRQRLWELGGPSFP
jgi:WD40 repeat protein/serine/threonine protein kinase